MLVAIGSVGFLGNHWLCAAARGLTPLYPRTSHPLLFT